MRRYFDPRAYRIVLLDQRGCGRSLPHASDPMVELSSNTTQHLVRDLERLRHHLEIERWLLFGASWGSTLALAYAERFPERVSEMVLASVVTTTHREIQWVTRDVGRYFPQAWERFRDGVPESERDGDLAAAYDRLLRDRDAGIREQAAREWCLWEDAHVAVHPDSKPSARYQDAKFRLAFARLVTHYWRYAAWLDDGILLRDAGRLARIPAVLIHGRIDLSSPMDIPWRLAQRWPGSELVIVDETGHGIGERGMAAAVIAATDRFARMERAAG
jgi:proline iminopeptidase